MSLFYSLLFIALLSYSTLASWQGSWSVQTPCTGTCCCPNTNTVMHFRSNPNNNSEVLMVGAFDAGISRMCAMLGWKAGIEIEWPWGINNFTAVPHTYTDANGISYTIAGQQFPNGTAVAAISTNQTVMDGSATCAWTLNNYVTAWQGPWLVTETCNNTEYCCCPKNGTTIGINPDPKNSSQINVEGKFGENGVCTNLGWSSGKATWPWGVGNFDPDDQDHLTVLDAKGVSYTVTIKEDLELNYAAYINMDQFSANGAAVCNFHVLRQTIHTELIEG